MRIACTFPGKHGDCLWALPTLRALSEAAGEPVTLYLSAKYSSPSFCELLSQQPYLHGAMGLADWHVQETAPMTPRAPLHEIGGYDKILHLGYERWPLNALPYETYLCAVGQWGSPLPSIDLATPWITVPPADLPFQTDLVAVGFTDEHFELKYGLHRLLIANVPATFWSVTPPGGRWDLEGGAPTMDWLEAAGTIRRAALFLGCCSALHVLAVAIGTPAVVMEPAEARWNLIFWPLGTSGPQVWRVTGGDGKPTWDARHTADTIRQVLEQRKAVQ